MCCCLISFSMSSLSDYKFLHGAHKPEITKGNLTQDQLVTVKIIIINIKVILSLLQNCNQAIMHSIKCHGKNFLVVKQALSSLLSITVTSIIIRVFACTTEFHFNQTCLTSVLPLPFSLQHSQEPTVLIHSSMTILLSRCGARWLVNWTKKVK